MTAKAQVKTQAKTPAAPAAARILQPPVAEPEHKVERPDIAAQLEGAARLGHSLGAVSVDSPGPPIIQRQEFPEEEEEELQLKREPAALQRQELPEEEEEELMMKPEEGRVGPQGGQVPPEVEAAIRRARGAGQPLDGAVQAQMSDALGHDFSAVRVHTGPEADDLNRQLSAKAFTTGPDIFFRQGEYNPGSDSGRELIAHELSHVVQQSTAQLRGGGGSGMTVCPAGDAFEREADARAKQGSRGSGAGPRWIEPGEATGEAKGKRGQLPAWIGSDRAVSEPVGAWGGRGSRDTSLLPVPGKTVPHLARAIQRVVIDEAKIAAFDSDGETHGHEFLHKDIESGGDIADDKLIGRLIENFYNRPGYTYWPSLGGGSGMWKHKGDCGTLSREFAYMARECYGLKTSTGSIRETALLVSRPRKVVGTSDTGNVNGGKGWFFGSHTWAVCEGKPIDVLFGQYGVVSYAEGTTKAITGGYFPEYYRFDRLNIYRTKNPPDESWAWTTDAGRRL